MRTFCIVSVITALYFAVNADAQEMQRRLPDGGKLEGSDRPGDKDGWKKWTKRVTMGARPDAVARTAELAARRQAIAADVTRLRARLQRAPDTATQTRITQALDELVEDYGLSRRLPRAFSIRDVQAMRQGQSKAPPGLIAAYVQFKKDLEARGVDLIVVPAPPDVAVYLSQFVPGVTPRTEVWPGWTQMQLELLDQDIEVLDLLDEFRADATNPIPVLFPNDGHTGSQGRRIMGRALAERLQRYDFARALVSERARFTYNVKTQQVNDVFSGPLYFAKGWDYLKEYTGQENPPVLPGRTLFTRIGRDRKREWAAPKRETMVPGLNRLKTAEFQYLEVKANLPIGDEVSRLDMVFVGDSQLHSAVHGSGLPAIVGAEIGGNFRWASKSWSGFDAPEIYLHTLCPDDQPPPRVVVVFHLPFKFWQKTDSKGKPVDEYKPRPLPPYTPGVSAVDRSLPAQPFQATIRIGAVSQPRDPMSVQYKDALTHSAATVVGGPYDGKVIGVRYWVMLGSQLVQTAGTIKPGQTFQVTLEPWDLTVRRDGALGRHMVYDDTDQDLTVPIFWVKDGPLSPEVVLKGL